jgi:hypothetical protein
LKPILHKNWRSVSSGCHQTSDKAFTLLTILRTRMIEARTPINADLNVLVLFQIMLFVLTGDYLYVDTFVILLIQICHLWLNGRIYWSCRWQRQAHRLGATVSSQNDRVE